VEQIRNHQHSGRNRTLQYLIHWKGYPDSDNTWESAADTHAPDLVKAYHKGTPLESIKAGHLSLQTPIPLHPGLQPRTSQLGRNSLDTTHNSALPVIPCSSTPPASIHHSQVHRLSPWTTHPCHSCPHSRTLILLPQTPLHLSPLVASTTPLFTSAPTPPLLCQTTLPMLPLNPLEAIQTHPHPATPLVEWRTYSPPTPILTLSPSERLQLVWSRPSRIAKKSIASPSWPSKTKSKGSNPLLKGTLRPMSEPQMGTFVTPCILTSRSHWAKEPMLRPTGLPQPMTVTSRHMGKSKDLWTHPTHSPSMPEQSTHLSPSNLSLPSSTSFWLVPPPFTLTSPKQPTNLMTGASLQISRATTNWTTTCPVSMQSLNGLKLKQGQSGLQRPSVKVDWSWLVPPSSWHTWSAW